MKEKFESTIKEERYTESEMVSLLKILADWDAVSPDDPELKIAFKQYDEYYKIYKSRLPPSTGDMFQDEAIKHPLNFQVRAMIVYKESNLKTQKDLCFQLIDLTYKENQQWNDEKGKRIENPKEVCAAFIHRLLVYKMKNQDSDATFSEIIEKVLSYNPSEPNLLMDALKLILNKKASKKRLEEMKLNYVSKAKPSERNAVSCTIDSLLNIAIINEKTYRKGLEKAYKKRLDRTLKTTTNYYIDIESIYDIAENYKFLNDKKNALKYYKYVLKLSNEESHFNELSNKKIKELIN
jgi:hypothetical protein